MPKAYQQMLGFFQLVNDVPGYEEMEFRRPELQGDAGRVKEGQDEGTEMGPEDQHGDSQPETNGVVGRESGWVEEEHEGEMGKFDT